MQQFEITLKNEKIRLYHRLSLLILLINVILFVFLAIFSAEKHIRYSSLATLVLLAAILGIKYYIRNTPYRFGYHPFFFFLMLAWVQNQNYWVAGGMLLFHLLYTFSIRKMVLFVNKENIRYPSFPVKTITWNQVVNVILKDDLLTINMKNNKFFQQFIDDPNNTINQQDFNEFCQQQLRSVPKS